MTTVESRDLFRTRFRQGQTLRSRDLNDELAVEAQLRAWHNRSATHNAFGIARGFRTTRRNERIEVGPGIAYDCFGRELILSRLTPVEIPESLQDMTLLVRYKHTTDVAESIERNAVCFECGDRTRPAQVELYWKADASLNLEDGVPVARLAADADGVIRSEKVRVRPLARPRIANGATIPGSTAWQLWTIPGLRGRGIPIGLQVTVDTSGAGFTQTPCYFAWLNNTPSKLTAENLLSFFLFFWHVEYVMETTDDHFTFRVLLPMFIRLGSLNNSLGAAAENAALFAFHIPRPSPNPARDTRVATASAINTASFFGSRLLAFAQAQQLTVGWLGIQSQGKE